MESTRYQERLTPDSAALLLIDHQVGLFTGVRDIPVAELKHNVVALAKALKVLSVPIIVTATSPEMWGPVIPELTEALPGISIINRTTVNAFDDARFAKAVEATGRKKLIIAGVSTEVCLALPAIFATGMCRCCSQLLINWKNACVIAGISLAIGLWKATGDFFVP